MMMYMHEHIYDAKVQDVHVTYVDAYKAICVPLNVSGFLLFLFSLLFFFVKSGRLHLETTTISLVAAPNILFFFFLSLKFSVKGPCVVAFIFLQDR